MNRILLMLLALNGMLAGPLWAQPDPGEWGCGTVLTPEGADYVKRRMAEGDWDLPNQRLGGALPTLCFGITCHIVRYSDGTEGIPEARVETAIMDLNNHMASASMEFFRAGDFIYIDSDEFAELTTGAERNELRQFDPVEGTIDVWFVPVLAGLCGESSFTFSQHQGIIMANACTASSLDRSTFSHEVGHYFDLFHTFETAIGVECVDGSNCDSAGDLVCDTAADFGRHCDTGETAVNSLCELVCTDDDPCGSGDPYDPPIFNFMSYTRQRCTTEFTFEQLARARSIALAERDDHIVECLVNEPGACCLGDDCFDVLVSSLCDAVGGTYLGAGTSCDLIECLVPGACCLGNSCVDVGSVQECVDLNGAYAGNGTSCFLDPCILIGACCVGSDCSLVTEVDCALLSGEFLGVGSDCIAGDPCQALPDACLKELDLSVLQDSEDFLGNAVSTSEGYILVGSMGRDRTSAELDTGISYLYNTNSTKELNPPTTGGVQVGAGRPGDYFGCSVSLSDDGGNGIAAVGAYKFDYGNFSDLDAGIAYAFLSPGWDDVDPPSIPLFNPSEYRNDFDYFGYSVAAAGPRNNSRVIVGAPRSNVSGLDSGSAYWFETSGGASGNANASSGTLVDLSRLAFSDRPKPHDYVGHAVGMCRSSTLFHGGIGAPGAEESGFQNAGRVYVATQMQLGPGSSDPNLVISVVPNHAPHLFKQFGRSIDLYDVNGTPYMIVGALVREGSSGSGPDGTGIAFVYEGSGGGGIGGGTMTWTLQDPLYPDPDPLNDDCAHSVSLTNQDGTMYALLGCPGAHANGLAQPGIAVLYENDGSGWTESSRLDACEQTPYDAFGHWVSIDESVVIGAPHALVDSQGTVYQKLLSDLLLQAGSGDATRSVQPDWSPADIASPVNGMGHPDGIVDVSDLMAIIELWGECSHDCAYLNCLGDLDGDCRIDTLDVLIIIRSWGS